MREEMERLFSLCATYTKFKNTFAPRRIAGDSGEADVSEKDDPVDVFKRGLQTTVAGTTVDFCSDLFNGLLDDKLKGAMESTAIGEVHWPDVLVTFSQIEKELQTHMFAGISRAAPKREVRRARSDASHGDVDETQLASQVWSQAQSVREKLVRLVVAPRNASKAQLQALFATTTVYRDFEGEPGAAHRMFVFSSELFAEPQSEAAKPWAAATEWGGAAAEQYVQFMANQTGPSDLLLFTDGRSRAIRRKLEDQLNEARWVNLGNKSLWFCRIALSNESHGFGHSAMLCASVAFDFSIFNLFSVMLKMYSADRGPAASQGHYK